MNNNEYSSYDQPHWITQHHTCAPAPQWSTYGQNNTMDQTQNQIQTASQQQHKQPNNRFNFWKKKQIVPAETMMNPNQQSNTNVVSNNDTTNTNTNNNSQPRKKFHQIMNPNQQSNTHVVSNNNTTNTNNNNNSQPRKKFHQTGAGKTAIGATSGAVIGGIIMAPIFPIGVAIGGAVGGIATNKVHSAGKKRQNRKQLETFQQQRPNWEY